MFAFDMPDLPQQYAQVMLVQASKSQQAKPKYNRTIGVCQAIENPPHPDYPQGSAVNSVEPVGDLRNYFYQDENGTKLEGPSTVTVLEMPTRGKLEDMGTFVKEHGIRVDTGERRYAYLPNPDYRGRDSAALLVEIAGMKIKLVYTFRVVKSLGNDADEILCGRSPYKRLSSPPGSDPLMPPTPTHLISFLMDAARLNMPTGKRGQARFLLRKSTL